MNKSPDDRCGYTFQEDLNTENQSTQQNCCWRKTIESTNRCFWHSNEISVNKTENMPSEYAFILDGDRISDINSHRRPDLIDLNIANLFSNFNYTYRLCIDGANLSELELDLAVFPRLRMLGVDLSKSQITNTSFLYSELSGSDFSNSKLNGVEIYESNLSNVKFASMTGSKVYVENTNLTGSIFWDINLSEGRFRNVNFSEADFEDASMSGIDLKNCDFLNAILRSADFSDSNLKNTNFSNANITNTDLSDADLREADLSDADLKNADLSGCDLGRCEFSDAALQQANIEGATVDGTTVCKSVYEGYEQSRVIQNRVINKIIKRFPRWWPKVGDSEFDAEQWDETARAYHDLKTVFNNNGIVREARKYHIYQRGARRCEAQTRGDWFRWIKSALVWQLTGYGISIRRIFRNSIIVFGVATFAYLLAEFSLSGHALSENHTMISEIFYYSVVTFTTTPPTMPTSVVLRVIVMAEAFLGTLLIVFLGYVLGTREQF